MALLVIDGDWWDHRQATQSLGWEWNLYRIHSVSWASILLAFRDLFSVLLILLPVAFTFGLLPQVSFNVFFLDGQYVKGRLLSSTM